MKILVLDNYDSFTYNLVYLIRKLGYGTQMDIFRNDKISLDEVDLYDKILLSPGPGVPSEAGIMPELLKKYASSKSILGVCLGHQAIGEAFGGSLINLSEVLHGVSSQVKTQEDLLFEGISKSLESLSGSLDSSRRTVIGYSPPRVVRRVRVSVAYPFFEIVRV